MKNINKILIAVIMLVTSIAIPNAHAIVVDTELSLLVDVSGSIDNTEFNLQRTGYANAFNDAAVINAIVSKGGIAANLVYWSSNNQQQQAIGWTLINDATSAQNFANAILAAARPFNDNTAPGNAINFAVPLFNNNGFEGDNLIIDVSGDGEQNDGSDTATARTNAENAGITINGLAIGNSSLVAWYTANVKTTDGFVIQAANFTDFDGAVKTKIGREVGADPVPEPATMLLMGSGLMGSVFLRKRKK